MDFTIDSHLGVGPIRFGMPRADLRRLLGPDQPVTKKLFVSPLPRDTFLDTGVHVYYREPDVCEAVELFPPAVPTLRGRTLLGRPYNEVERWLRQLDPSPALNATGLRSVHSGVGVYVPSVFKGGNDPVEGVIAFECGYYERYGL